jgi:hypothetical protein
MRCCVDARYEMERLMERAMASGSHSTTSLILSRTRFYHDPVCIQNALIIHAHTPACDMHTTGLNSTALRFFNVFGPRQDPTSGTAPPCWLWHAWLVAAFPALARPSLALVCPAAETMALYPVLADLRYSMVVPLRNTVWDGTDSARVQSIPA